MWCPECKKTSAKPFSLGWSSGAPFLGECSGDSSPSRNSLNQKILCISCSHLDIWPSGLPAIQTSDLWSPGLLAIWTSCHPDFWTSGHPDFWTSGHPDFWLSDLELWGFGAGHPDFWPSYAYEPHNYGRQMAPLVKLCRTLFQADLWYTLKLSSSKFDCLHKRNPE